jgi:hypothetical protein
MKFVLCAEKCDYVDYGSLTLRFQENEMSSLQLSPDVM